MEKIDQKAYADSFTDEKVAVILTGEVGLQSAHDSCNDGGTASASADARQSSAESVLARQINLLLFKLSVRDNHLRRDTHLLRHSLPGNLVILSIQDHVQRDFRRAAPQLSLTSVILHQINPLLASPRHAADHNCTQGPDGCSV